MQIKFFTIPILGGEKLSEDMNVFLRTRKILHVENYLVGDGKEAFWCVCIKYLDDSRFSENEKSKRLDYKEVLDEASFQRFAGMREIRKRIAQEESIPAYMIFTDEELAGLAGIADLTLANMRTVKGIGDKKIQKYGHRFIPKTPEDETS